MNMNEKLSHDQIRKERNEDEAKFNERVEELRKKYPDLFQQVSSLVDKIWEETHGDLNN